MPKQTSYDEGPHAAERFKALATALFQVAKNGRSGKAQNKRQTKRATSRKTHGSGKG